MGAVRKATARQSVATDAAFAMLHESLGRFETWRRCLVKNRGRIAAQAKRRVRAATRERLDFAASLLSGREALRPYEIASRIADRFGVSRRAATAILDKTFGEMTIEALADFSMIYVRAQLGLMELMHAARKGKDARLHLRVLKLAFKVGSRPTLSERELRRRQTPKLRVVRPAVRATG